MENTLSQGYMQSLCSRLLRRLSFEGIFDRISRIFDNLSEDSVVNYIGELNRNDVMH